MHVYTAEAKTLPAWDESGWAPSLEVLPDSCTVVAQNVCCQHVIFAYGNHVEVIRDCCDMMDDGFHFQPAENAGKKIACGVI